MIEENTNLGILIKEYTEYLPKLNDLFSILDNLEPIESLVDYIDLLINEIDVGVTGQLDEILHHEKFQQLEAAWRGLEFVVDRTDFDENVRLALLSISKKELIDDFEEEAEGDVLKSGLYHHVYRSEYLMHGGKPYAAIIGNYAFNTFDVNLLRDVASVAAMSQAPFIASVDCMFFSQEFKDFSKLNMFNYGEIKNILESPNYKKWQHFRCSQDACYVGLTLPRFLLRTPYIAENNFKNFHYQESVGKNNEHLLWGNTAFAFATCLVNSFARYGWGVHITGQKGGGLVDNLIIGKIDTFIGEKKITRTTDSLLDEKLTVELSEAGFIPFVANKNNHNACFYSANSVQKPKFFQKNDDGFASVESYILGRTRLSYVFMLCRMVQHIKILCYEELNNIKIASEMQHKLTQWIKQYLADQEIVDSTTYRKHPFRKIMINVNDVPGIPGVFSCSIKLIPHFKLGGLDVTLRSNFILDNNIE